MLSFVFLLLVISGRGSGNLFGLLILGAFDYYCIYKILEIL